MVAGARAERAARTPAIGAKLDWGEQSHDAHGRLTARAQRLRKSGVALVTGGLILLGLLLLFQLWL